jgi:hypothetical protein
LCNSHIIPEFFYDNIYDKKPRRFWYLTSDSKSSSKTRKIEQKGLRERLLCKNCERELSVYEKYAAEIIYAKNKKSPVILTEKAQSKNTKVYRFEGYDYDKFKLFLISILWRLSIAEKYMNTVKIDKDIQERLRVSLDSEESLPENDCICFLQLITHSDQTPFSSTIIGPYETEYKERQVINILIDGFLFSFIIGTIELEKGIQEHILNKDGKMSIASRCVNDDPNLMEAITRMTSDFGDLYKS